MGGNLFTNARRHELEEYKQKRSHVERLLYSQDIKGEEVRYFSSKTDFGDLDIIADRSTLSIDKFNAIGELYDYTINGKHVSTETFFEFKDMSNVDLFSFNYDGLQVDLIAIEPDSYEFALYYHAFNDLGGILGTMTKALGYRLGREGLYKNYLPVPGRKPYKLYLTKDYRDFANLFGIDMGVYDSVEGIRDHRHMYEYLKSCNYFRFDDMRPDLMNATRRNRASKRKTFNAIVNLAKLMDHKDEHRDNNKACAEVANRMSYKHTEYITEQMKEFDEMSRAEDRKVRSYTKERVIEVLGYEPDNLQEVMKRASHSFGGGHAAREETAKMDDEQFKQFIKKHL